MFDPIETGGMICTLKGTNIRQLKQYEQVQRFTFFDEKLFQIPNLKVVVFGKK